MKSALFAALAICSMSTPVFAERTIEMDEVHKFYVDCPLIKKWWHQPRNR
jgi:hypothetical protein